MWKLEKGAHVVHWRDCNTLCIDLVLF